MSIRIRAIEPCNLLADCFVGVVLFVVRFGSELGFHGIDEESVICIAPFGKLSYVEGYKHAGKGVSVALEGEKIEGRRTHRLHGPDCDCEKGRALVVSLKRETGSSWLAYQWNMYTPAQGA
jgi:hypothetical protein